MEDMSRVGIEQTFFDISQAVSVRFTAGRDVGGITWKSSCRRSGHSDDGAASGNHPGRPVPRRIQPLALIFS